MIHSKYDAAVSASDKRLVLPDDVMKYQVCFIVAIDGSRSIRNDTPQGMKCNVTLSRRGFISFFFLSSLAVGKERAFAFLSRRIEKRKMADADYNYL